jgi:hypothetical protein
MLFKENHRAKSYGSNPHTTEELKENICRAVFSTSKMHVKQWRAFPAFAVI